MRKIDIRDKPQSAQIIDLEVARRARQNKTYRDLVAERIRLRREIRPRLEGWLLNCFDQSDDFRIDLAEIAGKIGVSEIDVFSVVSDLSSTVGFVFWSNKAKKSIYNVERAPALARKRD